VRFCGYFKSISKKIYQETGKLEMWAAYRLIFARQNNIMQLAADGMAVPLFCVITFRERMLYTFWKMKEVVILWYVKNADTQILTGTGFAQNAGISWGEVPAVPFPQ